MIIAVAVGKALYLDPVGKSVQVFVLEGGHYVAKDFGTAKDTVIVTVLPENHATPLSMRVKQFQLALLQNPKRYSSLLVGRKRTTGR